MYRYVYMVDFLLLFLRTIIFPFYDNFGYILIIMLELMDQILFMGDKVRILEIVFWFLGEC